MELKDFISQSIKDIIDGIIDAQDYVKEKDASINVYDADKIRNINFDIAITTKKTIGASGSFKGKAGLGQIFVAGADLSGRFGKERLNVSRVSLTIPTILPGAQKITKNK